MSKFIRLTIADTGRTFYVKKREVRFWSGSEKGVTKVQSYYEDEIKVMESAEEIAEMMDNNL